MGVPFLYNCVSHVIFIMQLQQGQHENLNALLGTFESSGESSTVGDSDTVPTVDVGKSPYPSGMLEPSLGILVLHDEMNLS